MVFKMLRSILTTTIVSVAIFVPISSTANTGDIDYNCLLTYFNVFDLNGNNQLDSNEWPFPSFGSFDINGDGIVSIGEFFIAAENSQFIHGCIQ